VPHATTLPSPPVTRSPARPPTRSSRLTRGWEKARQGLVRKLGRALLGLLPLVLLLAVSRALWRELARLRWEDVSLALTALPTARVGLAVLATAASYLALTLYDVLALQYVSRKLPYRKVSRISFTACAVGHSIGLSVLGSGSVRYRLYSKEGLTAREVGRIVAFVGLTFWTGLLLAGGLCVSWAPESLSLLHLPPLAARAVGVGLLLLAAGYGVLSMRTHRGGSAQGLLAHVPRPRLAVRQLVVSSVDWMMAALVLYLLLPPEAGLSLPALGALFVAAQALGIASQVPGGLGVFEFTILTALSPHVPVPSVLGMLLAYRVLYYLLPLTVAVALFLEHEVRRL
jgi:phosphatidylglycerol lysyltransferase